MNMIEKVARAIEPIAFLSNSHTDKALAFNKAKLAIEVVYSEIKADKPTDVFDIYYLFDAALKE